ncbi:aryl hydrocarbon receptor [Salvelinus sp. IW2-2015]|uniref:aryl hydrocarbon receptor n=1 Tax=Salvelinus sp. IW2-2015 TaxID=2691554 RepID=UPI000CDFA4F7|nr:aryl hydrocarbon receptor isoform X1 [Salvelinus alpinus]
MLGNEGIYAAKKRKKPVQKSLTHAPGDGVVKTNPSKRHRNRLNGELDRLTSLLPFSPEVRGRLDKLSVLRLSVGYVKVKSFFHATLQKKCEWPAPPLSGNWRNGRTATSIDGVSLSEGNLLLQALNGFVLVVTTDGSIFYASPTIQDYLGFHQSDVVHQSVYELIHMDDRAMFRCQLHFALKPNQTDSEAGPDAIQSSSRPHSESMSYLTQHIPEENRSFLERSFCCRFRCLLDNSSGFLALNFQGRLKYVRGQGRLGDDGASVPAQLALFAIATPMQTPAVMEIRTKTLIFQTKHRLDFAPMGIDTRGKVVLGYSETELVTPGSGYQFIHAADMMYCADNHIKMIKTGETGFTIFRLLTKAGVWVWVQANARVVFKAGRPDFIIARQKALTNKEGEEHLHKRRMELPFNFATGEALLYESCPSLNTAIMPPGPPIPPGLTPPGSSPEDKPLDPASLLGSLLSQDRSVYTQPQDAKPNLDLQVFSPNLDTAFPQDQDPGLERAFLDSHALLSVPGELQGPQRPSRGDPTAQAMMDSLGEILGEMGAGGLEGLEVEETELREWESTLLRINMEQQDVTGELYDILANDVFSYVEEALMRERDDGCVKGSLGQGTEPINRLSAHITANQNILRGFPHSQSSILPGNQGFNGGNGSHSENLWHLAGPHMTSNLNSFGEQRLLGNGVVGGVEQGLGCSPGTVREPRRTVNTNTLPRAAQTVAGQWTQGSGADLHGNQMVPQPSHTINQPESWIPSIQNIYHNNHTSLPVPLPNFNNNLPEAFDQTMQPSLELYHSETGDANRQFSGQPYPGLSYQDPRQSWQQPRQHTQWQPRQIPQGFPAKPVNRHRHTHPKHSTHIPSNNASRTQTLTHIPSNNASRTQTLTHIPSNNASRTQTLTHTTHTPSGSCMFDKTAPNVSNPSSPLTTAPSRSHGLIPAPTHYNGPRPSPTLSNYCRTSSSTQAPKVFMTYPQASIIPRSTNSYPQDSIPNLTYPPASIPTPIPALSRGAQTDKDTGAIPAWSGAPYLGMKQLPGPFPSPKQVPQSTWGNGSCSDPNEGSLMLGQRGLEESLLPGGPTPGFPPENGSVESSLFYWNGQTQVPAGPNGDVDPFLFTGNIS